MSIFTLFMISLSGCGTPQYKAANKECRATSLSMYPPDIIQKQVNRTRYETVPDGNVNCYTTGTGYYAHTSCSQGTRTISIPYTAIISVDLNKDKRQTETSRCTESLCVSRYGNTDCDPEK